jgi:FAD/FMN-containing dehydrogenase
MTLTPQAGQRISALGTLISSFGGELIGPADASYDQVRKSLVWNGMHDRRPALIARCGSASDVRAALSYAQSEQLVVAVRGGGHSTPGYSSCDGGLVIDTGPMKGIDIDLASRTGHFGAGLTWAELDAATQEHGLAVTGGRVSHTGIAGFTLGSGSGWLERKYGMSCASLLSAEVVTADGRVLRASADENPDLLWGLKGGGGNFGVVTDFQFRLHPVGPVVYAGLILHPRAAAAQLTRFYRDFMAGAPDEAGGALAFITAPPADFVPQHARGMPVCGLIIIYVGDPADGEQVFRPLLSWGEPWLTMVQPMPYAAVQQFLDPGYPWGILDYSKSDYLRELPDDAIEEMVRRAGQARSPFSAVILCPLGGHMSRVDRDSMALNIPDTSWMYFCEATSADAATQDHEIGWARDFMAAMRPWAVDKAPPNFLEPDEGDTRLRRSYGEDKYRKLVALKDTYDPRNVFRLNGNVQPSAAARPPAPGQSATTGS